MQNCVIDQCHDFLFTFLFRLFNFFFPTHLLSFSQGARRIASEWPDLDSEAPHLTAKILGDVVGVQETTTTSASPMQSETSKEKPPLKK